jgi:UDP-GlcNAc3NAcA epimerase
MTDHAADLLLAPTAAAVENLRLEGLPPARVRQVGDVMCDAARHFGAIAAERSEVLERLGLASKSYALATLHRAENTDDLARLRVLVDALMRVATELPVVWPVHPRTRHVLDQEGWLAVVGERLQLIEPQGYMDMARLSQQARVIATDSGGLQKEAFFYGVPGVVLKEESEWHELVTLGWNRLAPPASAEAVASVILAQAASPGGAAASPYGDGHAAEAVAEALLTGAMTPR